ncbi:uncharacterized protein LOC112459927 [Temnothorax curvispinosus]|uniref:Uncharacterized protein LOC112459927 n=1 Tax=Temnothorax curvispinosus TaxID=300111 RepID=A0A6J1QCK8_9HYME|nr:uncharacterized protein LOC112459927 [Temnothorax curvispinosus]
MNAEYILSASLDETVSIWDQRTERIMRSITIPDEAIPTCMSMRRDNWVCVGDDKAKLHMLNLNNDIELVKSYSTEHTALITGGASDARMPDNEFSIRPRQNFDLYGSARAHRYFTFSVPRYPQHGLSE